MTRRVVKRISLYTLERMARRYKSLYAAYINRYNKEDVLDARDPGSPLQSWKRNSLYTIMYTDARYLIVNNVITS